MAQSRISKYALDLKDLNQNNESECVNQISIQYKEADAWLPLQASMRDMIVWVNKTIGKVIKIVDLKPLR